MKVSMFMKEEMHADQPTYCIDGGMEVSGHKPKEQNNGKTDKRTKQSLD